MRWLAAVLAVLALSACSAEADTPEDPIDGVAEFTAKACDLDADVLNVVEAPASGFDHPADYANWNVYYPAPDGTVSTALVTYQDGDYALFECSTNLEF